MTDNHKLDIDIDSIETQEWLDSFDDIYQADGVKRVAFLLQKLQSKAYQWGIKNAYPDKMTLYYENTVKVDFEPDYPGDIEIEKKIEALLRWNSAVIVAKANKKDGSLGGHIGSGASILTLYEVGFNHFFKAPSKTQAGDLIFYQGHTSPVIYARSFLEGRLTERHLLSFRQQAFDKEYGLSSYPHPWLQPNYWQFPTVSMGLGPIQAIYQARFLKYLESRELIEKTNRKVWAFCGDGEMDEPESLGAIGRASREQLDNLIFVINCNLQRLDGLVNGNGKIVEEYASIFSGAGWNVIKVLWSSKWQKIFDRDKKGLILKRLAQSNDGEQQYARSHGGSYIRDMLSGGNPEILELLKDFSDDDIKDLDRGGHDPIKVFAAYKKAVETKGQPTVILAHTVKGFGLGEWGESKNIAHNVKKLGADALTYLKNRFDIPVDKEGIEHFDFLTFDKDSKEYKYLMDKREELGGSMPARFENNEVFNIPHYTNFAKLFMKSSGDRELSTTTAFVRMLVALIRDKGISKRIVPVTVDESRTFGMEGLFRQLGIYNSKGQEYTPEDKQQIMYYKESKTGQIIQDGINEAGGFSSWLAAATSYSVNRVTMIPFYIYYSMFGFQRIGDLAWAAGDSHARGFLLGGTSGRTTLNGEGLQHEDGHSHIQAGLIPNCVSYDPTYAYELAVILWDGLNRMYVNHDNVFYYLTLMNENYTQREMPEGVEEGIIKGLYKMISTNVVDKSKHVRLMGSGSILREAEKASELLEKDFNISSDVWSLTSSNEVYRDANEVKRWNLLHIDKEPKTSYIEKCLGDCDSPIIASTDYIKLYTDQLSPFIKNAQYITLGTDGFGRSDSRENLRSFFEVDRYHIVLSAITALVKENKLNKNCIKQAIEKYNIDINRANPMHI